MEKGMTKKSENGRTHEPNLREITAELDGLRLLMDERDRRYGTQFDGQEKANGTRFEGQEKAVSAALAAQKELAFSASTASEKAINKAEEAQRSYNERSNEFRAALDDAQKLMLSRTEAEQRFRAFEDKLTDLKKDIQTRRDEVDKENRSHNQWQTGLVIGACLALAEVLVRILIR